MNSNIGFKQDMVNIKLLYLKAIKVISTCETLVQLESSRQYVRNLKRYWIFKYPLDYSNIRQNQEISKILNSLSIIIFCQRSKLKYLT